MVRPVVTDVSCVVDVPVGDGVVVAVLDEQPLRLALAAAAHANERERAGESLAVERELDVATLVTSAQGIDAPVVRLVGPAVPQHDGAAAVLAGGDRPLERVVLDRVILDLHGEAPLRRIERRPLRHRPALHHAVELEAEIVVEMTRGVLLDRRTGAA